MRSTQKRFLSTATLVACALASACDNNAMPVDASGSSAAPRCGPASRCLRGPRCAHLRRRTVHAWRMSAGDSRRRLADADGAELRCLDDARFL
jgi:hypothetical protein